MVVSYYYGTCHTTTDATPMRPTTPTPSPRRHTALEQVSQATHRAAMRFAAVVDVCGFVAGVMVAVWLVG